MAIWLVRAGKIGEFEIKFLNENRIYLTWDSLNVDLSRFNTKQDLLSYLSEFYEDHKKNTIRNWSGQIWPVAKEIKIGDWIVLPSKLKSAIHIAEVTGDYIFDQNAENPFYHYRAVKWFAMDIPRSNFDQDILYSFGAFMTVCRITRNDAEERIIAMKKNKWQASSTSFSLKVNRGLEVAKDDQPEVESDLEQVANDQIAKFLISKYKGHGMARLINAILKANGYTTHLSTEGSDKGVDILAAPGPMGFGSPRICVQVKTGDTPVDRPTLDQLIGAMQNFHADQGLLISWSGFKTSIGKEIANQFFRVRLWGQKEIIEELLNSYDKLDEDFKAELPLKRMWALSLLEDE